MFTGIITSTGTIESSEQQGDLRIKIICNFSQDSVNIGDSISCNGACLTVTNKGFLASGKVYFTADISAETIMRTTPGQWEKGQKVNLERSLKIGDTLDGHMVSGHVDGLATIVDITPSGDSHILTIEVPAELSRFVAEKGSVTLDGISLTINSLEDRGGAARFHVNIIPHTWSVTTLSERLIGDCLNLEVDMLARYVARLLQR